MPSSLRRLAAALPGALVSLLLAVLSVGIGAAPAAAHARLLASDPADGASVDTVPLEIVLRFSEAVSTDFATVEVTDPDGTRVDAEIPAVADDHVYTRLLPLSQPGPYTVSYRVVSADSHPVEGTLSFTLTDAALAAPPQPEDEPEPAPQPAEPAPQDPSASEPAADGGPLPAAPAPPTAAPSEAAPAPAATPTEPAPSEAPSELAAASDPPSSGISPAVLLAAIVVLVLLAGIGYLTTRGRGREAAGDGATPGETGPGDTGPGGTAPGDPAR